MIFSISTQFLQKMYSLVKEQDMLIRIHYFIFNTLTFKREKNYLSYLELKLKLQMLNIFKLSINELLP